MNRFPANSTFGFLLACASLPWGAAWAQASQEALPPVALPPVNVLLPNYTGVPIGEIGGLEVGAFLARADDSSSTYYNPAGLTRAEKTSVSGTAGVYQWGAVAADGIDTPGSSFKQVPAMFAIALQNVIERPKLSAGLSIARTNAWNQTVDFERTIVAGAADNRVSYSSQAVYDAWLANLGVGYVGAGKWRVGASLDGQWTITDRRQAIADQYRTANGFTAFSVTSRSEAYAGHLRVTAGTQYELTPAVILGAVVRTRGFGVYSSGFTMLEGMSAGTTGTTTASYFEAQGDVTFRVPFEFKTGAAWVGSRGEIEFDLLVYSGAGEYEAATSDQPVTVIAAPGLGAAPTVTDYAAQPPVIDSRAVVNVAVGGHFNLTSSGAWIAHGGYGTDRSPAGANDTVFTKVHLQKLTAGVSGRTSRFLGSFGMQYLWGASDPIGLRELPAGTLTTKFKVKNFGFVYSLAVLF